MPLSRQLLVASMIAFCLSAIPAFAQNKQTCVAAYENGQRLRKDGRLRKARAELLTCAQTQCPDAVVQECTEWLQELEASMPTLVLGARDREGKDLLDVRVSLDGEHVTSRLDGAAVPVDPGPHLVRYQAAGMRPVEKQIVVRQGEKNRLVQEVLEPIGAPTGSPPPGGTPPDARQPPVAGFVAAGVGVLALGSFAAFGLWALADFRDLDDTCAPGCTEEQVDPAQTKALVADISLGIGIAAAVVATVLFATAGSDSPRVARRPGTWSF